MEKKMEEQLNNWKTDLEAKLGIIQMQIKQTRAEERDLKEKLEAINRLLGKSLKEHVEEVPAGEAADDLSFTPTKAYWVPILEVLVELGGRGRREKVMELVGDKMKTTLLPADYAMLPDTNVVRWKNRVAWQTSNMRAGGLIKKDSPRGLWEITEAGRKWLDDKS